MKFAQSYAEQLAKGGYPQHWIDSAISYKKLKKCIKSVQKELAAIGLTETTLKQLLAANEAANKKLKQEEWREHDQPPPFVYVLAKTQTLDLDDEEETRASIEDSRANAPLGTRPFTPKLLFAIDDITGEPIDARLEPETKERLHQLAVQNRLTQIRISSVDDDEEETSPPASLSEYDDRYLRPPHHRDSFSSDSSVSSIGTADVKFDSAQPSPTLALPSRVVRMVEVPLSSDAEFFSILQSELSGLRDLSREEEAKLNASVSQLGALVSKITDPSSARARHDLAVWRRVFEAYVDCAIFFADTERDRSPHSADKAAAELTRFTTILAEKQYVNQFKRKESAAALSAFLHVNADILLNLRFQELNALATAKILKKFDKRTALEVRPRLGVTPAPASASVASATASSPLALLPASVARSACAQVGTAVLSTVPRLDDHLCPVCFSIAFRPVRLACSHVFCIRCLIVLQRQQKGRCPMCREECVLSADNTNIDEGLMRWLRRWFPEEVRQKQKDNEKAAGVDRYGEDYANCSVM